MPKPTPIDDAVASAARTDPTFASRRTRAGAAAALLAAVWVAALVRFRGWNANDDLAILQLHLERLGEGHVPLVGAYSRLDFHHPGPLREWVFGIAYWLSGRRSASLPATALTLNLLWTALACAMGWRAARRAGALAAALGALVIHLGLGWNLHSAWNPHLAALAAYAAVWGVVAVLARGPAAWPVPVVAGSFAAQLHVSIAAVGLGAALVAIAAVAAEARAGGARSRPALVAGATILLWCGPLLDLGRGSHANVVRLLRNGGGDNVGTAEAGRHVGRMLLPWSIARGEALAATGTLAPSSPLVVVVLAVALLAGALVVAGTRSVLDRAARMALGVALAVLLLVWATVAVGFSPPLFPYLFAPAVGALAIVGAAIVLALAAPVGRVLPNAPTALGTAAVWLALATVVLAWAEGGWSRMQPIATAPLQQQIDAAVRAAVSPGRTYTVEAAGLVESVAEGEVALAVQQAGAHPRSDIFALGLPPAVGGDPVLLAAMGAPLSCLLGAAGAPRPIVLVASTASGLDVAVFLVDDHREHASVTSCTTA